ncbi:MAG: hypothetical protein GY757_54600, partial [bacterium]|nr:hypothetical protein [bacterium]
MKETKTIPKAPEMKYYPVSLQQEGVWLQSRLEPGSSIWNSVHSWRYEGPLDLSAFGKAVETVIRRQALLRTNFILKKDKIYQYINETATIDNYYRYIELSAKTRQQKEAEARTIEEGEGNRHCDPAESPLIRVTLLRLNENGHILILSKHHIIFDATSRQVFLRQLAAHYNAAVRGENRDIEPLEIQYYDYAVWQREYLGTDRYGKQKEYWLKELSGPLPLLNLLTDTPRDEKRLTKISTTEIQLDQAIIKKIRPISLRKRVSFSTLFMMAYYILLMRYSGQEDIIIGSMY